MGLLETKTLETAEGKMKEALRFFNEMLGEIPGPLRMLSVSPALFNLQTESINYYSNHPHLGFQLLSLIRYLSAEACHNGVCITFNGKLLKKQGMEEEEIRELKKDPSTAPLEEKDKAMLLFVMKAVKNPDEVDQTDVDALRKIGWTDTDIFDAVAQGANMVGSAILTRAFKIDSE